MFLLFSLNLSIEHCLHQWFPTSGLWPLKNQCKVKWQSLMRAHIMYFYYLLAQEWFLQRLFYLNAFSILATFKAWIDKSIQYFTRNKKKINIPWNKYNFVQQCCCSCCLVSWFYYIIHYSIPLAICTVDFKTTTRKFSAL